MQFTKAVAGINSRFSIFDMCCDMFSFYLIFSQVSSFFSGVSFAIRRFKR